MKRLLLIICAVTAILSVHAQSFCISERGKAAPIAVDNQDWPGVIRAAGDLADDIRKVTGTASRVVSGSTADTASIIVGTIGKSRIIDRLVRQRKLNVSRWVNTTTLPKLREQLSLAYHTGIDRIWIINVGDLKPKEVPIDFIMHYAWNPDAIQPGDEQQWLEAFTNSLFGGFAAKEAADLISKYTKYNLWRKAEAQVPGIFNMEEMAMTDSLWLSLAARAEALRTKIPAEAQDAYYQLVYYPVVASAGVALLYNAATRGNAPLVGQLMARDRQLSDYYHQIAGGKWNKMMQDKHIGYTQWSMPQDNTDPTTLNFNTGHAMQEQPATNEYSCPVATRCSTIFAGLTPPSR